MFYNDNLRKDKKTLSNKLTSKIQYQNKEMKTKTKTLTHDVVKVKKCMSTQNILLFLVEFFSDVMLIAKLLKECLYIFFPYKLSIFKKKKKLFTTS